MDHHTVTHTYHGHLMGDNGPSGVHGASGKQGAPGTTGVVIVVSREQSLMEHLESFHVDPKGEDRRQKGRGEEHSHSLCLAIHCCVYDLQTHDPRHQLKGPGWSIPCKVTTSIWDDNAEGTTQLV
ncbi:hypothetical protein EMCRGX_G032780 [Ephydatia muelleri]